jgi:hypothetical protein
MKFILSILSAVLILMSCSTSPNNTGGSTTTVIPLAPSNLTGVLVSSSQVNLTWTDHSTNETGFKIERKIDGAVSFNLVGTVNADVFSFTDTGLVASTNYTYRVMSYNAVGNSLTYSNEFSISTGGVPVLSTNTISTITFTTAVSGGNITNDGGTSVTVRGVVWSTTSNPTITLSTKTTDGNGIGAFNSNITGLNANTTYYLKAYATNANGTGYGNEQIFITNNYSTPTITTTAVSSIGTTTAISGGDITSDGGSAITFRGVCWSTTSNPTITLSTKTVDGTGTGNFTSNITGLTLNTTYHVRAYATNSVGTAYGSDIEFTTINVINLPSVTICAQTWTTNNLDVTTYRNGDAIPQVTDPTAWANLTTGAWCYYNNDAANGPIYGKLYNWYAVTDPRGLAPQGWHVPSDAEWNKLVKCIDPSADTTCQNCTQSATAGGAMKETGTSHWISPNTGATNSSGFAGLPGGYRDYVGTFYDIGHFGSWWSSTESSASGAWGRFLGFFNSSVTSYDNYKTEGFSVRCLRD